MKQKALINMYRFVEELTIFDMTIGIQTLNCGKKYRNMGTELRVAHNMNRVECSTEFTCVSGRFLTNDRLGDGLYQYEEFDANFLSCLCIISCVCPSSSTRLPYVRSRLRKSAYFSANTSTDKQRPARYVTQIVIALESNFTLGSSDSLLNLSQWNFSKTWFIVIGHYPPFNTSN